jgi:hypothetical protein
MTRIAAYPQLQIPRDRGDSGVGRKERWWWKTGKGEECSRPGRGVSFFQGSGLNARYRAAFAVQVQVQVQVAGCRVGRWRTEGFVVQVRDDDHFPRRQHSDWRELPEERCGVAGGRKGITRSWGRIFGSKGKLSSGNGR